MKILIHGNINNNNILTIITMGTSGKEIAELFNIPENQTAYISMVYRSSPPVYIVFTNSNRPNQFITKTWLSHYSNLDFMKLGLGKVTISPPLDLRKYNGARMGMVIKYDIAHSNLTTNESSGILVQGKLHEITLSDLRNADSVDPHVTKFAKERKSLMGGENKNAKLIEGNYDVTNDTMTYIFLTEATEKAYPSDYKFKQLQDLPNYNSKDSKEKNKLEKNPSKTYELHLRFLDVVKNIKELDIENEITRENMKALIEISEVQIFSNSPAYLYTGIMYNDSVLDCAIKTTTIAPTKGPKGWADRRGNSFLDKHLKNLLAPGSIDFFLNNMASMLTGKMKKRGFI